VKVTQEQYARLRRGAVDVLNNVLGGQDASMMVVEGEGEGVKLVVLCATGPLAGGVVRAVEEVMGNPDPVEQWEVPG
jgi:hypothetical protein